MAALNIIPPTMRARHHETGEWQTLIYAPDGWLEWGLDSKSCYVDDGPDGGLGVALADFDMFEAIQ